MKINFMIQVDKFAGGIIIPLLFAWSKILSLFGLNKRTDITIEDAKVILIQKYLGVGSIINTLPLLHSLRKANPSAKIIYITFDKNKELFDILSLSDEVMTVRSGNFLSFALDVIKAIFVLRSKNVDICFDLEFYSAFSKIFSFCINAAVNVGFSSRLSNRCLLVTHEVPYNHYRHISRIFLAFAERVGVAVDEGNDFTSKVFLPSLYMQNEKAIRDIVGERDCPPIITINVVSSNLIPLRKWKKSNFIEIVSFILERYPKYKVVLIGLPEDIDYVADVYNAQRDKRMLVNAVGKTNLSQLFSLIEKSYLLISNDSGPAHIAAGYNVNSVVLFGPETPVLYKPLNNNLSVVYKDVYCSPCIHVIDNKSYETCHSVKCMDLITPNEIQRILEEKYLRN